MRVLTLLILKWMAKLLLTSREQDGPEAFENREWLYKHSATLTQVVATLTISPRWLKITFMSKDYKKRL